MTTRREVIALLGATAAAWPLAARAQPSAPPTIGFLSLVARDQFAERLQAFHRGLADTGHVEGRNVTIEYRWADYQYNRLPELAADLLRKPMNVVVATSGAATRAARAASTSTPIVFYTGEDPVQNGIVESLNRPGPNLTGVYNLATEVGPKRLELLRQLVPSATEFAVLLHPDNPGPHIRNLQAAAQTLGVRLHLLPGKSEHEFGAAFAAMAKLRAGGLVITADLFFAAKSRELAALATKHAIPAAFHFRDFVEAGGLMSYGTDLADSYHVIGTYAGRILKGATPGDLPVQQSTKVQLIINLKTAKALGLTVPLPLLGRADEVIE